MSNSLLHDAMFSRQISFFHNCKGSMQGKVVSSNKNKYYPFIAVNFEKVFGTNIIQATTYNLAVTYVKTF